MYLTRICLNLRNRRVQRELANRYELHRTVMHAFAPVTPDSERPLFRLEEDGAAATLLVQSCTFPNWEFLAAPEFSGYLLNGGPNPQMKSFEPVFSTGQQLYFRLLANPTHRTKESDEEKEERKGKRRPLLRDADLDAWLKRKCAAAGFSIPPSMVDENRLNVSITDLGWATGCYMDKEDKRHHLAIHTVRYEGVLTVTHADLFLHTVQKGLGSAKGFGCGLLSVARA